MRAWLEYLLFGLLLVGVFVLVWPLPGGRGLKNGRTQSQKDFVKLLTAIRGYHAEYGRYPGIRADGKYQTMEENAALLRVLRALDPSENPKSILFFEAKTAARWWGSDRGGMDIRQGAFLDYWGTPYRVIVDADEDCEIDNPYEDASSLRLRADVIAWSLGKDRVQGNAGNPRMLRNSDDLLSWR